MKDEHGSESTHELKIARIQMIYNLIGKSFLPIAVIAALFVFKPAINSLLEQTDSAEFLGVNISFKNNPFSFKGDLSAKAIYYLIYSSDEGKGVRYEDPEVKKAIDELKSKGLITWKLEEFTGDAPHMRGMWLFPTPTNEGWQLLMSMGVTPYKSTQAATNKEQQLLVRATLDWKSYDDQISAIGGVDASGVSEPYANCYPNSQCNVLLITPNLPIKSFIIYTSHNVTSFTTTLYEKKGYTDELIPTKERSYSCQKSNERNVCKPIG